MRITSRRVIRLQVPSGIPTTLSMARSSEQRLEEMTDPPADKGI
jgi:hypothetical protein